MENLIKMDDLGVPLFLESSISNPTRGPTQTQPSSADRSLRIYLWKASGASSSGDVVWPGMANRDPAASDHQDLLHV